MRLATHRQLPDVVAGLTQTLSAHACGLGGKLQPVPGQHQQREANPSTRMDRPSAASTSFSSSIAAILLGQHGEWLAQSSLGAQLDLGCIILRLQA
jgi:hypothetical protein